MFYSTGIVNYSIVNHNYYKIAVEIDQSIGNYYYSMIPKYINISKPFYPYHITLLRKEVPKNLEYWNKYQHHEIEFQYENIVRIGSVYCWLNAYGKKFEEIRQELGLEISSPFTLPPEGFFQTFHCTIGNFKNANRNRQKIL